MTENGTSSAQIKERTPKTSQNTPQNGGVDIWFMRFHFRASIKPIFENHVFRAVSGPFHPLYETKISNRSPSVVYGSITLKFFSGALGTSLHQWFNHGNKIKKKCFWDTLLTKSLAECSAFPLSHLLTLPLAFSPLSRQCELILGEVFRKVDFIPLCQV